MTVSSFTKKQLRATFELTNQETFNGAHNALTIAGLRMVAQIKNAGAPVKPEISLQIFGMLQSDMNILTALEYQPLGINRNNVKLEANDGTGWTTVFSGQIITAGPDYTAAPDVMLRVHAVTLYFEAINPAPPSSYPGQTDVAVIVENIATAMGKTFENNGVVGVFLDSPYLPNTAAEQLSEVVAQAGIDLYVDGDTIAICPKGQPRAGSVVVLNAQSGLIGYPTIDNIGVHAACVFNAGLKFGGPVQIQSDVPKANGSWYIYALDHTLESEKPGGLWLSQLGCSEFGRLVVPDA